MFIIYTERMLHELGLQKVIRAPRWLCLVGLCLGQLDDGANKCQRLANAAAIPGRRRS